VGLSLVELFPSWREEAGSGRQREEAGQNEDLLAIKEVVFTLLGIP